MTNEKAVMILLMEIIKAVSNGADFDYSCEPMNLTITINERIFRQADFLGLQKWPKQLRRIE